MEVKTATISDINDIVTVHLSAFPGFFLSELGDKFLKLYYRSVLESKDGILLVCRDNEKLVGFCAACTRSSGFNSNLIKDNLFKFGIAGLRICFSKPMAIVRLVKNLTKKGDVEDPGEYSELLSIGVAKDAQGKGVGGRLLQELENELKHRNVTQLSLTTDFEDNENALHFYSKIGFGKLYEFIAYPNRKMYRLIKDLN